MRKTLTFLAAALVALATAPLYAQVVLPLTNAVPAPGLVTADDTDIALLIKYVGTGTGGVGKVEVAADDLVFTSGAAGATADTEVNSAALCGASVGTIDTGDSDCNTIKEVIDTINKTNSWRAVPVDSLLADNPAFLLTAGAAFATGEDGLAIYWDTSERFKVTRCLNCPRTIGTYLASSSLASAGLVPNRFGGKQTMIHYIEGLSTFTTQTYFEVYSAKTSLSTGATAASTETFVPGASSTGYIFRVITGSTGASATGYNSPFGLLCAPDARCLVMINGATALSAVKLNSYGITFPVAR